MDAIIGSKYARELVFDLLFLVALEPTVVLNILTSQQVLCVFALALHDVCLEFLLFLVQGSELAMETWEFVEVFRITSVFFLTLFQSFVKALDEASELLDDLEHVGFLRTLLAKDNIARVSEPFLLLLGFLGVPLEFTLVVEIALLLDEVLLELIRVVGETRRFGWWRLFTEGLAEILLILLFFFFHDYLIYGVEQRVAMLQIFLSIIFGFHAIVLHGLLNFDLRLDLVNLHASVSI